MKIMFKNKSKINKMKLMHKNKKWTKNSQFKMNIKKL